jgi:hypothetical protein
MHGPKCKKATLIHRLTSSDATACVLVLGVLYEHFDPQQYRITTSNIFTLLLRVSVPPELIFVKVKVKFTLEQVTKGPEGE